MKKRWSTTRWFKELSRMRKGSSTPHGRFRFPRNGRPISRDKDKNERRRTITRNHPERGRSSLFGEQGGALSKISVGPAAKSEIQTDARFSPCSIEYGSWNLDDRWICPFSDQY